MKFTALIAMAGLASGTTKGGDPIDWKTGCMGTHNGWFFSLTKFDKLGGTGLDDRHQHSPAAIDAEFGQNGYEVESSFYYKVCQPGWTTAQIWKNDHTKFSEDACQAVVDDPEVISYDAYTFVDNKCIATFNSSKTEWHAIGGDENKPPTGWTLKFTANEKKCPTASGEVHETITFEATCDHDHDIDDNDNSNDDDSNNDDSDDNYGFTAPVEPGCHQIVKYKGEAACPLPFNYIDAYKKVAPFIGAILIVLGLLMTFAGAKFLFMLVASLMVVVFTGILFTTLITLFLAHPSGLKVFMILIFCAVCGMGIAFVTYSFTKMFAVPFIAAAAGGIAMFIVSRQFISHNAVMMQITCAIIGGLVAGYAGYKLNKEIRIGATAFVGAILVVQGVAFYYEIFNVVDDKQQHMPIGMNLGMFFVLLISGAFVQFKIFKHEDEHESFKQGE